jgi:hypothetical protein
MFAAVAGVKAAASLMRTVLMPPPPSSLVVLFDMVLSTATKSLPTPPTNDVVLPPRTTFVLPARCADASTRLKLPDSGAPERSRSLPPMIVSFDPGA